MGDLAQALQCRTVTIASSGIFVPQDVHNELWQLCILEGGPSFSVVAEQHDNSWQKLLDKGFNANFLTRERWLDVRVLVEQLHVTLDDLSNLVDKYQVRSWRLTPTEWTLLTGKRETT